MNALATRKRLTAPIHDAHTMPHSPPLSNTALGPASRAEVPHVTLPPRPERRAAAETARSLDDAARAPAAQTPHRLVLRRVPDPATRISAVILSYNEADRLEACLRSVSFCDEILVVDSHSTDGTAALARQLGARVIERPWPGYRSQREFAIAQARHDWILSIDADEIVSPALYREILRLRVRGFGRHTGFQYPRALQYLGRSLRHGNTWPDRAVRLFDRRHARYTGYQVHERLEVAGPIGRLEGTVEHHSYRSLEEHQQRMQKYARLWAEEAHGAGKHASVAKLVFNPPWRFVRGYVLRGGFRDGWRGLVFHCIEAAYVRQKYLNLYALERAGQGRATVHAR